MRTPENTTKSRKFRTFLRYAWGDSVSAHRASPQGSPYDDYLRNHRGGDTYN